MVLRTDLPSGLRVVTEHLADTRSATIGFWVAVGGRDEPAALAGASHFLEHLIFKGTETHSARWIAESVEAVGGEMNAFTSREHTAYYLRLPAKQLDLALGLLVDVLSRPALRAEDLEAERQVILEELALSDDTPEDRVHTNLAARLFAGHQLGREVLGDVHTVEAMTASSVQGFFRDWYRPSSVVVTAAGAVDHEQVVAATEGFLADVDPGTRPDRKPPAPALDDEVVEERDGEQAHLAIGWRSLPTGDPDRYALAVLDQVLGGGMASRLFQEIREERGLAYTVDSGISTYSDAGAMVVYAGTAPERLGDVRAIIDDTVTALVQEGITPRELAIATGYLEGAMVLALEDSGSRMSRLGRATLAFDHVRSIDDDLEAIAAVTREDVQRVAQRVLSGPRVTSVVSPKKRTRRR